MNFRKIIFILILLFNSDVFILYGVAKLTGFQFVHIEPPLDTLLKNVRASYIMWYFFSLKKGYSILIALSELIPALLILFKRTRFVGGVLYLITITNILAINIFL